MLRTYLASFVSRGEAWVHKAVQKASLSLVSLVSSIVMDTLSNLTIKETLRELKEIHQGSTKLTAYDHPHDQRYC